MINDNEPSLEKLDDYNGKESREKRQTIILVLLFTLAVGAILSAFDTSSFKKEIIDTIPKSNAK